MYIIYLKNFPQAISTMERLNKESKDFKKFLQVRDLYYLTNPFDITYRLTFRFYYYYVAMSAEARVRRIIF